MLATKVRTMPIETGRSIAMRRWRSPCQASRKIGAAANTTTGMERALDRPGAAGAPQARQAQVRATDASPVGALLPGGERGLRLRVVDSGGARVVERRGGRLGQNKRARHRLGAAHRRDTDQAENVDDVNARCGHGSFASRTSSPARAAIA